jgi:RimJ/RimL family protein N-acetyltransferase
MATGTDDLDDFVERMAFTAELRDGTPVRVRPIAPKDRDRLAEGWERFSDRSRYLRFLQRRPSLSESELRYLTEIDYSDHFAWGAEALEGDRPALGIARYIRVADEPTVAEAAVAVVDEYQGRGLGGILLQALGRAAASNGIERFRAYVSVQNTVVIEQLTKLGAVARQAEAGTVTLELPLPEQPWPASRLYASLRTMAELRDEAEDDDEAGDGP